MRRMSGAGPIGVVAGVVDRRLEVAAVVDGIREQPELERRCG